jgi:hypothetical protein
MDNLTLKLNERTELISYKNVKSVEIMGEFLIITHKPSPKVIRTEPISLSIINYWECEA